MWACIFQNNEHVEDVCYEKDTKDKVFGAVAEVFPSLTVTKPNYLKVSWAPALGCFSPGKEDCSLQFSGGSIRKQWQWMSEMEKSLTSWSGSKRESL
jgi:hypothetical protein